jgi:hypothetical protein
MGNSSGKRSSIVRRREYDKTKNTHDMIKKISRVLKSIKTKDILEIYNENKIFFIHKYNHIKLFGKTIFINCVVHSDTDLRVMKLILDHLHRLGLHIDLGVRYPLESSYFFNIYFVGDVQIYNRHKFEHLQLF